MKKFKNKRNKECKSCGTYQRIENNKCYLCGEWFKTLNLPKEST